MQWKLMIYLVIAGQWLDEMDVGWDLRWMICEGDYLKLTHWNISMAVAVLELINRFQIQTVTNKSSI